MMIDECDSCGFKNVEVEKYEKYNLCDICASTHIGSSITRKNCDEMTTKILKTIGYCTNTISKELRKK